MFYLADRDPSLLDTSFTRIGTTTARTDHMGRDFVASSFALALLCRLPQIVANLSVASAVRTPDLSISPSSMNPAAVRP